MYLGAQPCCCVLLYLHAACYQASNHVVLTTSGYEKVSTDLLNAYCEGIVIHDTPSQAVNSVERKLSSNAIVGQHAWLRDSHDFVSQIFEFLPY